ncbi:hypothetical protein [Streptomyces sp. NPDC047097]|uniref:hypothetical protein n=1 Tax=Streptomyces sp. NPDC047097 TaxID=3155260 RepID=UPI0033F6B97E
MRTRLWVAATRCTGRLVCWSLALAMATGAVEASIAPDPAWWRSTWLVPWWATPAALLLWAPLRVAEKRAVRAGGTDSESAEPEPGGPDDRTAYDTAA